MTGREAVRQTLAQTAAAVHDAGTPSTGGGDTGGLRSQPGEWRKSDHLDIPAQQDNPRS